MDAVVDLVVQLGLLGAFVAEVCEGHLLAGFGLGFQDLFDWVLLSFHFVFIIEFADLQTFLKNGGKFKYTLIVIKIDLDDDYTIHNSQTPSASPRGSSIS